MRLKTTAAVLAIFFSVSILVFPYESFVRFRLAEKYPAVRLNDLSLAPWGGEIGGLTVRTSAGKTIAFDAVKFSPAGIFPPAIRFDARRGAGHLRGKASIGEKLIMIDASFSDIKFQECVLEIDPAANLVVQGEGLCVFNRAERAFTNGSAVKISAAGNLLAWPGAAALMGRELHEFKIAMDLKDGAWNISELRVATELSEFSGSGAVRPAFPLSAAQLHVVGQAVLAGRTFSMDKTFPLSPFF